MGFRSQHVTVALLGMLALLASQPVAAQEVSKGLNLADAMLSFNRTSSGDVSTSVTALSGVLTRLLTDRVGAGGALTLWHYSGGGEAETSGSFQVRGAYFLSGDRPGAPYAFAQFGLGFGQEQNPKHLGLGLGYTYLFGSRSRGAGLTAELGYQRQMLDGYSTNTIQLAAGVSLYFRRN